ncbi:hypothetical protein AJ80_06712 [Polytolypa hystricis UAMH7299]|uniref:Uncharacterized protein n=1 Tax=Polytolypa hystricis (strain UAMH7299) TaxID=1447883 RepID=A0A2B7XTZ0_POLH7|nr:hypothetical protein AJ80_06712 [Polytolypa hystricis UAMH7299]
MEPTLANSPRWVTYLDYFAWEKFWQATIKKLPPDQGKALGERVLHDFNQGIDDDVKRKRNYNEQECVLAYVNNGPPTEESYKHFKIWFKTKPECHSYLMHQKKRMAESLADAYQKNPAFINQFIARERQRIAAEASAPKALWKPSEKWLPEHFIDPMANLLAAAELLLSEPATEKKTNRRSTSSTVLGSSILLEGTLPHFHSIAGRRQPNNLASLPHGQGPNRNTGGQRPLGNGGLNALQVSAVRPQGYVYTVGGQRPVSSETRIPPSHGYTSNTGGQHALNNGRGFQITRSSTRYQGPIAGYSGQAYTNNIRSGTGSNNIKLKTEIQQRSTQLADNRHRANSQEQHEIVVDPFLEMRVLKPRYKTDKVPRVIGSGIERLPSLNNADKSRLANPESALPPMAEFLSAIGLSRGLDDELSSNDNGVNSNQERVAAEAPLDSDRKLVNRRQKEPLGFVSPADRLQTGIGTLSISDFSVVNKAGRTNGAAEHTEKPPFNIFQEIFKELDLIYILAKHMRLQEMLICYRISKRFHQVINFSITTVINTQALYRAPASSKIFPFRCYAKLCMPDPAFRSHPDNTRAAAGETRTVPSFRWLQMICFRDMVCHQIMAIMDEDGVPLPEKCEVAMKKVWFLMDIPENTRRIAAVQNPELFTDADLFFATMFFVKVDMRFTDPVSGSGSDGMRRLMMCQPSLSVLWKTLKRVELRSKLEIARLYFRCFSPPEGEERRVGLLGIPQNEIGIGRYENWGRTGSRVVLQRPDELVLKESIRRRLDLHENYKDMFLWGYVNQSTMENAPSRSYSHEVERLEGLEELLDDDDANAEKKKTSSRVVQKE